MNLPYESLPFPTIESNGALVAELADLSSFTPYVAFRKEYCTYDCAQGAAKICRLVFGGATDVPGLSVIDGADFANDRENVLMLTGSLMKNGLTTARTGLIRNIDRSKPN